jgi:DNA-binding response OmpR family regulator
MKNALIVEDEARILEVVKSLLESAGFTAFIAETGRKALEIFERENLSLVLLDLMLPDISGEEVCAAIRKKSRVPIIMLTAKAQEADMLRGLGSGADDYITKPFSLKVLRARIEAVLRRASDGPVPLFNKASFGDGDLEIDFISHTVTRAGGEVRLTPSEFRMLAALVKHPHRVFTRDELITVAMGEEFDGYDRAVDSHIKNLRQKIERDPKKPAYIVTVHGVGYKLGAVK